MAQVFTVNAYKIGANTNNLPAAVGLPSANCVFTTLSPTQTLNGVTMNGVITTLPDRQTYLVAQTVAALITLANA